MASAKGTKPVSWGLTSLRAVPVAQDVPLPPATHLQISHGGLSKKKPSEKKCHGGKIRQIGAGEPQEQRSSPSPAMFIPLICNTHPPHLQSRDGHTVGLHRRPPRQPWGGVRGRHRGVGQGGVDEALVGVPVAGRAGRLRPLLQGQLAAGEVQLAAIPEGLAAGHVHLLLAGAPRAVVLGHHDERGHAGAAGAQRRGVPQRRGGSAAAASGAAQGLWGGRAAGDTWWRGGTDGLILAMLCWGDVPANIGWVSQALWIAGFPAGCCAAD